MAEPGAAADDLGDLTARLNLDTSAATSAVQGVADGFPVIGAAALAAGAAVAGIGLASTKMASDFQQSLTLIRTQAGDTTDNLQQLGDALLNLGPQVGQTPEALAQAFFHLASAGFTGAQGLDILRQSAELADVGQANLEETTNAVVGALKSGVPGIKNAADAVGVLNAIVGSGNMHMQDLVDAMGSGLLPVAGTFGVTIQSVGAALSFMTDQGVPAADAATRLRMSLALMAAPTAAATKLLTDAGVSAKDAADQSSAMQDALEKAHVTTTQLAQDLQKPDGIVVALQDLKTHMTDAGVSAQEQAATIARAFGGGRSGSALIDLYSNLDGVRQKFDDINKRAGNFAQDWAAQSQTAAQKAADFHAQLDQLSIRLGNILLPAATAGLSFLTSSLDMLSNHVNDIAPVLQRMGDYIQHNVVPGFQQFGEFIQTTVVPALEEMATWFEQHILPTLEGVANFIVHQVIPAWQLIAQHIASDVLPALEGFGTFWANDIADPLINVAEHVIPVLLNAIDYIAVHFGQLEPILVGVAAAMAAMWATDKITTWYGKATSSIDGFIARFNASQVASTSTLGGAPASTLTIQKVWIVGSDVPLGAGVGGTGAVAPAAAGEATAAEEGAAAGGGGAVMGAGSMIPAIAAAVAGIALVAQDASTLADTLNKSTQGAVAIPDGIFNMLNETKAAGQSSDALANALADMAAIGKDTDQQLTSDALGLSQALHQAGISTGQLKDAAEVFQTEYKSGTVTNREQLKQFLALWDVNVHSAGDMTNALYTMQQVAQQQGGLSDDRMKMVAQLMGNGVTYSGYLEAALNASGKSGQAFQDALAPIASQAPMLLNQVLSALMSTEAYSSQVARDMQNWAANMPDASSIVNPITGTEAKHGSIAGAYQSGGIIPPGRWGIVNEVGGEPIFAGPNGAVVVPNSGVTPMGGGVTLNVFVEGAAPSAEDIARAVAWEMAA